jgi:hypothetical protein
MIGRMWTSDLEAKEEILTDILLSNIISRAVFCPRIKSRKFRQTSNICF